MTALSSIQKKIAAIQCLQKNMSHGAYIAHELERRLLEHLPNRPLLPGKQLDMLRDCAAKVLVSEALPYTDAMFTGVTAHLVPLWQENLTVFFQEIQRILVSHGFFLFSTLSNPKARQTLEMIGDILLQAGFQWPVVDKEILHLQYDDKQVLVQDLELSGLNQEWVQVLTRAPDDIIAKFEIIYGYALGKIQQTLSATTIEIPVANLSLRKTW